MTKICYITTVPMTLKAFIAPMSQYIHDYTDWDISYICDDDTEFAETLPDYIHFHPVRMRRGISISGIRALFEMYRIFKREKFDLIQYSTPNASLYAALAGVMARIPVRLYCQWGMAYVGFSGIKRTIFRWIEKIVCALSTWIEPDSESNLHFAHNEKLYSSQKGSVVWNGSACGVDLEKFNPASFCTSRSDILSSLSIPTDACVFGFVGRITRDKGVNELLSAFQRIVREYKSAYLLMVGPDDHTLDLNPSLLEWSRTSSHVIYTGFTNQVPRYLSVMDVYVLPSYREGFGVGVIEAEAMELPVIVTDIPGPTDAMIPGKTGLIVPKADQSALEQAMRELLNDCDMRLCFGKAGRQFVYEHFEQQDLFSHILADRKRLLNL